MVVNAADSWLYGVLIGDVTLTGLVGARVYGHLAPQEATFPLVLFAMRSGVDVQTLGPNRIMSNLVYVVRGVTESSSFGTPLSVIAERIDVVLQAKSGTTAAGAVYACVREQPYTLIEMSKGRQYRHLGGIYRLYAK